MKARYQSIFGVTWASQIMSLSLLQFRIYPLGADVFTPEMPEAFQGVAAAHLNWHIVFIAIQFRRTI